MDQQKVVQVLKQIFEQRGVEIVGQQNQFRAAVFDLLDSVKHRDERLILRNAIESGALMFLVTARPITGDTARNVMEQMTRTGHMKEEDAEFVTRCFIIACGEDPAVVMSGKEPHIEEGGGAQQERVHTQWTVEQSSRDETQSKHEDERKLAILAIGICVGIAIFIAVVFFV